MMTQHEDEPNTIEAAPTVTQPSPRALRIASVALLAVMMIMSITLWILSAANQQDQVQRGTGSADPTVSQELLDTLVADLQSDHDVSTEADLELAVRDWLDDQSSPATTLVASTSPAVAPTST